MRSITMIVLFLLLLAAVSAADPVIEFASMKQELGPVTPEQKPELFFEFSNSGDKDLVIEKVTAS